LLEDYNTTSPWIAICVRPSSHETCCVGEFSWELDTVAEPCRSAPATSSNPQLASTRWSAPLQPTPSRLIFEPSQRHPRRRQALAFISLHFYNYPYLIPYLPMTSSCCLIYIYTNTRAVPSCRSTCLSTHLSNALDMCYSMSCGRLSWFLLGCSLVVCEPCIRAGRRIISRLVVSVVGLSRRGCDADRNSLLHLLSCLHRTVIVFPILIPRTWSFRT
jgi:hypothetical protein